MDREDRKAIREERKLVREKMKLAREERRQTEKSDEKEKKLVGPWRNLHAALWMFGLAIIAWQGWWWPGILVLVGLSVLLEGILMQFAPQAYEKEETEAGDGSPSSGSAAVPPETLRHPELLPTNCPRCGGPTRGHEVHWTGPMSADCPYCGANLPMQKKD